MDDTGVSRRLSFVLRHDPASIGIVLDEGGWAQVPILLEALALHGLSVERSRLEAVVRTSRKQRFALDAAGDRIRANQGHSVSVELGLEAAVPPRELYHGTPERNVPLILSEGMVKGVWLTERVPAPYLSVLRSS